MSTPAFEQLAAEYGEKLTFGKLDVDANQKTAMSMRVSALPTFAIYKDGVEIKKLVGLQSKKALKAAIDGLLSE
jgi:thioredoxin 1